MSARERDHLTLLVKKHKKPNKLQFISNDSKIHVVIIDVQ